MNLKLLLSVALAALACAFANPASAQDYSDHTAVLAYAETLTDPHSGEPGQVTWFRKDLGNGQLSHNFVYDDPRRAAYNGAAPGLTYAVKEENISADTHLVDPVFWLHESVMSWGVRQCAELPISENTTSAGLPGVVETYFATGNIYAIWEADLTQVGFRSAAEFPYFAANPNVLGVTFTLTWVDGEGNPTDIDDNGKADVAFREIYYNDDHEWADNGVEGVQLDETRVFDFPTVAIHEVGHGFSTAHFGSIGFKRGQLFSKPLAVMNAIYGGMQRELRGRDHASACATWDEWASE